MGPAAVVTSTQEDRISFLEDNGIPQLVAQAALYVLTFAMLRDSSDLHIYKDLYGENNDCFCNL